MTITIGRKSSNMIVPLANVTKRTKLLDISSSVSISIGTVTTKDVRAIFYSDSAGTWFMDCILKIDLNGDYDFSGSGTQNITFDIGSNFVITGQGANPHALSTALAYQNIYVETKVSDNIVRFYGSSSTIRYIRLNCLLQLESEPTTYTTSAYMENLSDVSAYIPPASDSEAGIVSLSAQTIGAGVKTFSDGIAVGATKGVDFSANTGAAGETSSLFDWYEEGTFSPTWSAIANITGSTAPTTTAGYYTRIGRQVFCTLDVLVEDITNNGTSTQASFPASDLPFTPLDLDLVIGIVQRQGTGPSTTNVGRCTAIDSSSLFYIDFVTSVAGDKNVTIQFSYFI